MLTEFYIWTRYYIRHIIFNKKKRPVGVGSFDCKIDFCT